MFSELERLLLKPGTLPPCSPVCASGTRTRGSCRPPSRGRGPGPSSAGSRCPGSPCSRGVCGHRSRGTWRGGSGPRGGGRRPGAPAALAWLLLRSGGEGAACLSFPASMDSATFVSLSLCPLRTLMFSGERIFFRQ